MAGFRTYAERLIKSPVSTTANVILTPPWTRKCLVLNKANREIEESQILDPLDHWSISQVFIDQDYDLDHLSRSAELREVFQKRTANHHKSLILDAGANIGASARYLAQQWPGSTVWMVEPSSRNVGLAEYNKRGGMCVIHAALGPEDGHCVITNASDSPNAFRTAPCSAEESESCPMLSMQSILNNASQSGLLPWILKVDIEGAEHGVFKGASAWLPHWPVLMIELHDWMLPGSASSAPVLEAIAATGRDAIIKGSTLISICNPPRHESPDLCLLARRF